jgi:hypothetical protein
MIKTFTKVKHNQSSKDEISELLVEWIRDYKQAFKVVENPKFRKFIIILDFTKS